MYREKKEERYGRLPESALKNVRLDVEALALLSFRVTCADSFVLSHKIVRSMGCSKDSFYKSLNTLVDLGYLERQVGSRKSDGSFNIAIERLQAVQPNVKHFLVFRSRLFGWPFRSSALGVWIYLSAANYPLYTRELFDRFREYMSKPMILKRLQELEAAGLVMRIDDRKTNGSFAGTRWQSNWHNLDQQGLEQPESENPGAALPDMAESGLHFSDVSKATPISSNTNKYKNTDQVIIAIAATASVTESERKIQEGAEDIRRALEELLDEVGLNTKEMRRWFCRPSAVQKYIDAGFHFEEQICPVVRFILVRQRDLSRPLPRTWKYFDEAIREYSK